MSWLICCHAAALISSFSSLPGNRTENPAVFYFEGGVMSRTHFAASRANSKMVNDVIIYLPECRRDLPLTPHTLKCRSVVSRADSS